ncbi:MAG: nicotinate phosphoribosyltransferase [Candidatus Binatia bacterium]
MDDSNRALLTDLYQLTMLQAYFEEGMEREAVFDLFVRNLPATRNYLVACGIEDTLEFLETLHFDADAIAYLAATGKFSPRFLERLKSLHFTGEVWAVPEGTVLFANEPILEVIAPLPEAQLIETYVMNQIHLQTLLASKAARVVSAAEGRKVADFALRRTHGTDAGLKAARAFYVAGVSATSNVLAGKLYGIPVVGTMAHSYVQAHDDERAAFRAFAALYPDSILLIDTYDTLEGVKRVIELSRELGDRFRVSGLRLDSGDLATLAKAARRMLDEAGLDQVELFASGGLDEWAIAELVAGGAPIGGFGVGTRMGVSEDAPSLDMSYKLVDYAGSGRIKLSPGKPILPGRKQVFRRSESQEAREDVITVHADREAGRPLLAQVMKAGRRLAAASAGLAEARARARQEIRELPAAYTSLARANRPFPVRVSRALLAEQQQVMRSIRERSTPRS